MTGSTLHSFRQLQANSFHPVLFDIPPMLGVEIEFGNHWIYLDTARNIQLQAHKSKNPSANAGVSINSVVARGGIDLGLRMLDPD